MKKGAGFALLMALLPAAPGFAQDPIDPDAFCRKAGKNQAIYQELFPDKLTAKAGSAPGAVTCDWVFRHYDQADVLVTLDSKLLKSPFAARQAILTARLPENHRGKEIEPLPKMGDDALSRSTRENGQLKLLEIEAVKGQRHFLLTVRTRDGSAINYRIADATISFLGIGIRDL